MNLHNRQSEPKRSTANLSGLVIAALGFQLLLCSAASAAHACTGTIDRIPSSVVHALREIVDRQVAQERQSQVVEPGYRLSDCPLALSSTARVYRVFGADLLAGQGVLNLPPPTLG